MDDLDEFIEYGDSSDSPDSRNSYSRRDSRDSYSRPERSGKRPRRRQTSTEDYNIRKRLEIGVAIASAVGVVSLLAAGSAVSTYRGLREELIECKKNSVSQ